MKTAGEILRAARLERGLTLDELSNQTKIQRRFLKAIEESNFKYLPGEPFVKGFIRTAAVELHLNPDDLVAVFRRDFGTDSQGNIIPVGWESPAGKKFHWSPKITVALAVAVVVISFAAYLAFQLILLLRAPELTIIYPQPDAVVTENVLVEGKTATNARVTINGQEIKKNRDGIFSQTILLTEGTHTITVIATGQRGQSTTIQRTVQVKTK